MAIICKLFIAIMYLIFDSNLCDIFILLKLSFIILFQSLSLITINQSFTSLPKFRTIYINLIISIILYNFILLFTLFFIASLICLIYY